MRWVLFRGTPMFSLIVGIERGVRKNVVYKQANFETCITKCRVLYVDFFLDRLEVVLEEIK